MTITDQTVSEWQEKLTSQIKEWRETVRQMKGMKVRVLSNYNGQSHGSSRKSLKGTEQVIASASISDFCGIIIALEGYEYGCPYLEIDEWEFIQ